MPRAHARPSVDVAARVLATPVLEWAAAGERTGSVLTIARDVCYLRFADVVVALGLLDAPTMPNEVSLGADLGRRIGRFASLVSAGDRARLHPDGIDVGRLRLRWRPHAERWDPRVIAGAWSRDRVRARGETILLDLGVNVPASPAAVTDALARDGIVLARDEVGRSAIASLLRSLSRRDPDDVGRAAARLLGLGAGLTPEGDDLLAAAAVTVVAFGPSVGLDAEAGTRFAEALTPDATGRTTALSATLLALARTGRTIEPVCRLLDLDDDPAAAIERLSTFGHTTGRMYLTGVGATAIALASG